MFNLGHGELHFDWMVVGDKESDPSQPVVRMQLSGLPLDLVLSRLELVANRPASLGPAALGMLAAYVPVFHHRLGIGGD